MKGFPITEVMVATFIVIVLIAMALSFFQVKTSERKFNIIDEIKKCKSQLGYNEMCILKFDHNVYEIYIDRAGFG